jgi:hypothetical protein
MEILLNKELMIESIGRNWGFFFFYLFFLVGFLFIVFLIISCLLWFNYFESFSPFSISNISLKISLFLTCILWVLIGWDQSFTIINQKRAYIDLFLIFIDLLSLKSRLFLITSFLIFIFTLLFFSLSNSLLF